MNFLMQVGETLDPTLDPSVLYGLGAVFILLGIFAIVMLVIQYLYFSFTLMKTSKKLGTEPSWLAWIPIANLYLKSKMAKMHWWPITLIFPIFVTFIAMLLGNRNINVVFGVIMGLCILTLAIFILIWEYKICERRNRPGWWALIPLIRIPAAIFSLVPIVGSLLYSAIALGITVWRFVMWGMLAWGE